MDRDEVNDPASRGMGEPREAFAPADVRSRGTTPRWSDSIDRGVYDYDDDEDDLDGGASQLPGPLAGLQDHVTDLLNVRSLDDLKERVMANPLGSIAVAAGVGYMLQRSHMIDGILGAAVNTRRSRHPDDLTPAEERLLAWLNDAYAMERAQLPTLENHADDAERHPEVRAKDIEHLEQTREHVRLVKECIHRLGAKPSKVKSMLGTMAGAMNSVSTEPFDDEVVRNFLQDYAAENMEIASYRALIVAAEEAGHRKIAKVCARILKEEEAMAAWLKKQLPNVVRETIHEVAAS